MPDTLVQLADVTLTRGARTVLDGVDLAVGPGERVALLGVNGSGKTSLLHAIAGLLPTAAVTGTITLDGHDALRLRARDRARLLSYVSQESPLAAGWRARELVELGRIPWRDLLGRDRPGTGELLTEAHRAARITHLVDRRMDQLSGGERRRVLLARGYAQAARVLLLDEPLAHLDLGQATAVLTGASQQAALRDGCVVAALHDPTQALAWATRVVLVANGVVLADGSPEDVMTEANLAACYGVEVELLRRGDGQVAAVLARGRPDLLQPRRQRLR